VRWRTSITLTVLLVVLLGAAYYGWKTVISPATGGNSDTTASDKPTCKNTQDFHKGQIIKAQDIAVNVYNAGAIAGLAADTLDTLTRRGFQTGVADNAPANVIATNVKILTEAKNAPQVQLVASQFRGKITYSAKGDVAPGIDVVVGDNFVGMKKGAKSQLRVQKNVSICTSVDIGTGTAAS
jgi:hypothetical protein